MRYTHPAIHKLYKQLMSQKCKTHTDVRVWTKNDNIVIPELVNRQERNIQATEHQSRFSEEDTYFPEDNNREDESEEIGT